VVAFTGLQTKTTTKEILLTSWLVKKEIVSGNSLDSQAQFEDLRLKYCIQEENAQNTLSGRSPCFLGEDSPPCQIAKGTPTSHWWEPYSRTEDNQLKVRTTTELTSWLTAKDYEHEIDFDSKLHKPV
jgi:hypothetical protein